VLVGFLVVAVVVMLLSRRYERRRSEAMATAASQHGLAFELAGESSPEQELLSFHLFNAGRGRKSGNVMRGSSGGIDVVLFDYKFVTGSGKSQSTHQQTVAGFRLEGTTLPGFELRHEHIFYKIAALFGYQDIDFPEHPEFSRRYLLRGSDEAAVRALFSPALIEFFQQLANENRWWVVEGTGERLLVYRPEKRLNPAELPQFLQDTTTVTSYFRKGASAKFGF
jgi:hypothetical protein